MTESTSATSASVTGEGQTTQPPGEAHTTTTTGEAEARNIRSADAWKYPDDYPVTWLRGRTADEAGQLFNQIYTTSLQGQPQQPQQVTPQPYPQTYGGQNQYPQQPPAQTPQYTEPSQDDWLSDPASATKQYLTQAYGQRVEPQLQRMQAISAQNARELVRQAESEMFAKYGPEIDQLIGQMSMDQRTPDNIRLAVQVVRGNHVDEIAEQRAKAKLTQMQETGGFRADGTVTPSPTGVSAPDGLDFDISKLPPNYAKVLERNRVTAQELRTFLQKTEVEPRGISMREAFEEWLKDATEGDMVVPGEVFSG